MRFSIGGIEWLRNKWHTGCYINTYILYLTYLDRLRGRANDKQLFVQQSDLYATIIKMSNLPNLQLFVAWKVVFFSHQESAHGFATRLLSSVVFAWLDLHSGLRGQMLPHSSSPWLTCALFCVSNEGKPASTRPKPDSGCVIVSSFLFPCVPKLRNDNSKINNAPKYPIGSKAALIFYYINLVLYSVFHYNGT